MLVIVQWKQKQIKPNNKIKEICSNVQKVKFRHINQNAIKLSLQSAFCSTGAICFLRLLSLTNIIDLNVHAAIM